MNPDLFIACGGPAGLATAIVAAHGGLSIVVSEAAPPPIDKACGVGLSPDALEVLPYLGVDFSFIESFHIMAFRFLGTGANPQTSFPHDVGLGLWRTILPFLFSVLPKRPVAVSSGIQPSVASRQPPLLPLSMIETRNQLDMFSTCFKRKELRMHHTGPDYQFEAFHAIESIADEGFLFNWSKTNPLAPLSKVFQPTNEQELRSILRGGYETVRVVGSTLSFEPVHSVHGEAGPAVLINLRSWTGQVAVGESFVTYKAATTVEQLYADLIEMDRMLPACPGVIGIQTLAGALGTGTHGQGLRQSTLGDAAISMKVMLADGQIQLVEREDPRFGAFMLSMGCLGVVLEVSFRTVPNVIMKCLKLTVDQEWLIANHERLNREHLFVKTWWFAWTGEAHVWLVDPASEFEVQAYRAAGCLPLDLGSGAGSAALLDPTVEATMLKMGADTKNEALDGQHIETMRRFKNGNNLIGNVYQLLCKGIPAPQINCEVSIPFDKSVEAFGILRQWQQEHPDVLHYPFILRCCGASEAWLSPAYGQPVCWIGFLVYLAADGQFARGSLDWMHEVQARLARLGGGPHMGKHFSPEIYKLSERTRWRDFDQLRKELDPNGLFENQFVKRLFAHSVQEAA